MRWTCRRARIACAAMSSTSSRRNPRARRCASSCSTRPSSRIALFDPLTGEIQRKVPRYTVYPGSHYVTPKERVIGAIDFDPRGTARSAQGAARAEQAGGGAAPRAAHHVRHGDDERGRLLLRHRELLAVSLSGRAPGEPPPCLFDYLPQNALLVDRRDRTRPFRSSAPCTRATARARRRWWNTASACRARSTTAR